MSARPIPAFPNPKNYASAWHTAAGVRFSRAPAFCPTCLSEAGPRSGAMHRAHSPFLSAPVLLMAGSGFLLVLMLGGCELIPGSFGGSDPGPKAGPTSAGGALNTTMALSWIGLAATVAGVAMAVGRTWVPIFPRGTGILTAIAGVVVMWVAELIARHWWIMPAALLILVVIGIVEYLGRDKVRRWVGRKLNELKDEAL